jgi:uncharacterized protein DUF6184
MTMTLIRTVLIVACTAATIACNKNDSTNDRASQTTTTKGTTTSNAGSAQTGTARYELATARIVGARCDREVTCVQNGANKRFETRDICTRDEAKRTQDELKASECPNGIDNGKLQTCLSALGRQDCGALISSLQTLDVCKTSALCIGP